MIKRLIFFVFFIVGLCGQRAIAAISGPSSVCKGSTITLTGTPSGGMWTSSNTAAATIDASGVVTGVASSTATTTISYSGGGTLVVTANNTTVSGNPFICNNQQTTLSGSPSSAGGTWSSSNTAVINVSSSGVITKATGASSGTATITYTKNGCIATKEATLVATVAISGAPSSMCMGQSTTLSYTGGGGGLSGAWSVNNALLGAINSAGVLTIYWTGVGAGLAGNVRVFYTFSDGTNTCATSATQITTYDTLAVSATNICVGAFRDLGGNGIWTSANTSVADFHTSNSRVWGIGAGTTTITYTHATGCTSRAVVTVNAAVSAIGGTKSVCVGNTTTLTNSNIGGTWTSANTSVATVTSGGVVTGVSAGTATISYQGVSTGTGCSGTTVTTVVTVNALPTTVTASGGGTFCDEATITASNGGSGTIYFQGTTWNGTSTADPATSKTVTASGTYYFRARSASGCWGAQGSVTVVINPTPDPITGLTFVAVGGTITLANATAGGAWSVGSGGHATVDASTGVVTGVSAGTATISYTITTGCGTATTVITVTISEDCLTNSLVINTGYDPTTGTAITGLDVDNSTAPTDPKWILTTMSTDADNAITSQSFTRVADGYPADVVNTNLPVYGTGAWASSTTSSWITGHNAHGYDTYYNESTPKDYWMTLSRTFRTCVEDDIVLDLNVAVDNSIDAIIVDGTYTVSLSSGIMDQTSNTNFHTLQNVTATLSSLPAGTHTVAVTVRNYDFPTGGYNPTGLLIEGNVHSLTDVHSIVAETGACVSYECEESAPRGIGPNNIATVANSLFTLYPNPNSGDFVLSGTIDGGAAQVTITDVTGKIIYNEVAEVTNGHINKTISLGKVASGNYILKLTSGKTNLLKRLTIDK